jgi:16S rRNA (uracil1498-N3)-methyltransferase
VALSAVKQCGRAVIPALHETAAFGDALASLPRPLVVLAEPASGATPARIPAAPPAATILIGPEGGWAPAEVDALAVAGATFVQLGGRTLRADAAPLVALAVLLWEWEAL